MSDFFSDLESAIKRVASNVNTEVTRAAREQKVREAFQSLGRLYYQAVQEGTALEGGALQEQVERIEILLQEINELRNNQKMPE